jgi:hypothetical protein
MHRGDFLTGLFRLQYVTAMPNFCSIQIVHSECPPDGKDTTEIITCSSFTYIEDFFLSKCEDGHESEGRTFADRLSIISCSEMVPESSLACRCRCWDTLREGFIISK